MEWLQDWVLRIVEPLRMVWVCDGGSILEVKCCCSRYSWRGNKTITVFVVLLTKMENSTIDRVREKKALSDIWLTSTRFSFQIALYLLVKQKVNLSLHQVSLGALFRAPLELNVNELVFDMLVSSCFYCHSDPFWNTKFSLIIGEKILSNDKPL